MAWKLGTDLTPEDRREALAAHDRPSPCKGYPVLFASDAEWLAHTRFRVNGKGRLDRRARHCYSQPPSMLEAVQ